MHVVTGGARDLFLAIASAAAALTGLLFVAMSVTPRPADRRPHGVIHQVRSAAALLALSNALASSPFGLVPGNNVGYPAAVLSVAGATARSRFLAQLPLLVGLTAVFVTELVAGVQLLEDERNRSAVDLIGNLLVTSTLFGVARAWEFAGDRDTGIWSSLTVLTTGHERPLTETTTDSGTADPGVTGPGVTNPGSAGQRGHGRGGAQGVGTGGIEALITHLN